MECTNFMLHNHGSCEAGSRSSNAQCTRLVAKVLRRLDNLQGRLAYFATAHPYQCVSAPEGQRLNPVPPLLKPATSKFEAIQLELGSLVGAIALSPTSYAPFAAESKPEATSPGKMKTRVGGGERWCSSSSTSYIIIDLRSI